MGAGCSRREPQGAAPSAVPAAQSSAPPLPTGGATVDADRGGASAGPRCGSSTCAAGEECCNPSCGICVPAGGFCTQQVCEGPGADGPVPPSGAGAGAGAGGGGSGAADAGRAPKATRDACRTDADCSLYSSYCNETPCACIPHGRSATPTCKGPSSIRCLVDPCAKKLAVCRDGACAAKDR